MKSAKIIFAVCLALLAISQTAQAQFVRTAHDSRAAKFSEQTAAQIMRGICPNTGKNPYAIVREWIFDEENNEYEIKLEAYWTGATCLFCDDQTFEIDGRLVISANRANPRFTRTWESSAVKAARSNNRWFVGTVVALAVMSASSSSK